MSQANSSTSNSVSNNSHSPAVTGPGCCVTRMRNRPVASELSVLTTTRYVADWGAVRVTRESHAPAPSSSDRISSRPGPVTIK